jgi:hypothetical protein
MRKVFFEWWGLVRGLKKLEEQLGRIKAVFDGRTASSK